MEPSGFNTILHAIPDSMALVDANGQIISVNRTWERFASENGADAATTRGVGMSYIDVCQRAVGAGASEAQSIIDSIEKVRTGDADVREVEYECHSPNEKRWFIARVTLVTTEPSPVVLISHVNITKRKLAELRIQQESQGHLEASLTDSLTGLRNGRGLDEAGQVLWHNVRSKGDMLAAIFLDLNAFKPVNDKYGHVEGDRVLKTVADHLNDVFRDSDVIARIGGDEFVVLARIKRTTEKVLLTDRLRREFPFSTSTGEEYRVTTSVGVAVHGEEQFESLNDLLQAADERMYADKKRGAR